MDCIIDTFANIQFLEIPQVTVSARYYEFPLKGIAVSSLGVSCPSLSGWQNIDVGEAIGPPPPLVVLLVIVRIRVS